MRQDRKQRITSCLRSCTGISAPCRAIATSLTRNIPAAQVLREEVDAPQEAPEVQSDYGKAPGRQTRQAACYWISSSEQSSQRQHRRTSVPLEDTSRAGEYSIKPRTIRLASRILPLLLAIPSLLSAVNPHLSISPTSGTLGVTSFTETYTGFTPNGGITEYATYPNGGVTPYTLTANSAGSASSTFVLQSQSGNYSAYAVDNATGTRSNTITYTVNRLAPTISSINPTSVQVNQATSIYVNGNNFVSGFNAQAITSGGTFSISDTQFISSGQVRVGVVMGGTAPYSATLKIINPDGQSATTTFQVTAVPVPAPTISSISPTSVQVNQATSIYVNGSNFRSGFTAQAITSGGTFSVSDTQYISASQVRVGVVMGGTAPYTATLKIVNPDGQSATMTFQVTAAPIPPPSISSISPTSVQVNQTTSIYVNGTNFRSGFTAQAITSGGTFSVSDTQYISASQVRVGVVMGGAAPYTATLKIINPDGQSATTTFQVTAAPIPPPSISSISPTSVQVNQTTSIYVNGTNFRSGFSAQAITSGGTFSISDTQFISASQVRVGVVMSGTAPYTATLKIINPDGQSATTTFQVTPAPIPAPTISSISPTSVQVNQTTSIYVNGSNFQSGFTAQAITSGGTFQISDTQYISASQVRVGVVMGGTAPYTATLKIINPDGQSATTSFQVTAAPIPAPTISTINPTSVQANQTTSIYVNGSNFRSGFTAQAITSGGTFPISDTQFISASQVRVGVVMGGTAPYTATLKIINPDGQSATTTFQVTPAPIPAPTISSINPTSVQVNQTTSIYVNGSNFQSGFTAQAITSGGTFPISDTQFISASQVRVGVVMGGTAPYTATLKVINPDGQTATTTFQVTAAPIPPPSISSINPTSVQVSQTTSIYVNGSNFRSGFTAQAITSGGAFPISDTQFISATQVRVGVVMGGTAPYTATLKVINPDGQSATATFQVTAAPIPAPTISSINPTSVQVNQTTSVYVNGNNFQSGFTAQAITSGGTFPISDTQYISSGQVRVGVVMGGTAPYTAH